MTGVGGKAGRPRLPAPVVEMDGRLVAGLGRRPGRRGLKDRPRPIVRQQLSHLAVRDHGLVCAGRATRSHVGRWWVRPRKGPKRDTGFDNILNSNWISTFSSPHYQAVSGAGFKGVDSKRIEQLFAGEVVLAEHVDVDLRGRPTDLAGFGR